VTYLPPLHWKFFAGCKRKTTPTAAAESYALNNIPKIISSNLVAEATVQLCKVQTQWQWSRQVPVLWYSDDDRKSARFRCLGAAVVQFIFKSSSAGASSRRPVLAKTLCQNLHIHRNSQCLLNIHIMTIIFKIKLLVNKKNIQTKLITY